MMDNTFDAAKKGDGTQKQQQGGASRQQYEYAVPVQPGAASAAAPTSSTQSSPYNNAFNFGDSGKKGNSAAPAPNANANSGGSGGAAAHYNIDLSKQDLGPSNYPQYPEAEVNLADGNEPPVEGTPLYAPEEVAANPRLKRFVWHGFKDMWAAILFLILFLLTVVWGIVNLATYKLASHADPNAGDTPAQELSRRFSTGALIAIFVISLVVSLVGAIACLFVARLFPAKLIYIANLAIVAMYIASAIMFAVAGEFVGFIVMLVFAGLQLLWVFLVRSRIPFAAALLTTSSRILNSYKAIFLTNILLSLAFFVFCVFWSAAMLPPTDRFSAGKGNAGDGVLIGVFVLAFLWTAQVVVNLMHVTTSGVVATWYFAGAQNMPKNPTLAAFQRATTSSFGSICFGSLLVAAIQFVRFLLESSRNGDGDNNFLRCVADCMLRCLENIVQYFNTYAFVHVAIYGCGYVEAAKRTFALCQQCFFAGYFNDCLVGPTLNMLALVAAVCIGCVFALITTSWGVFVFVFALAWIVHQLLFSALSSAITALFVCFAEKPEALQMSDPVLYAVIHAADGGAVHNGTAPAPTV